MVARLPARGAYINGTNYNRAPINPGLYDGPYMITGYDSGNQIVHGAEPALERHQARLQAHRAAPYREHGGAAGEPAVR